MSKDSILLIDDNAEKLDKVSSVLSKKLKPKGVEVRNWIPSIENFNSIENIDNMLKRNPILVVTNYGLPGGLKNVYGPAVVNSCKANLIPVGEFSNQVNLDFLQKPNLFDIRISCESREIPTYITHIYSGFKTIRKFLDTSTGILNSNLHLSEIIAGILGRKELHYEFYRYTENMDRAGNNLFIYMTEHSNSTNSSKQKVLKNMLSYVIGHLILNSILKFPGPIISENALCSYLSIKKPTDGTLSKVFAKAKYKGPFSKLDQYYWRRDVDTILYNKSANINGDYPGEGAYNRAILNNLGVPVEAFNCKKCSGDRGGYFCPFTKKTVCADTSCSVSTEGWVTLGADLCRIERNFHDKWSPLL